jgi:hypothetical protein
MEAGPFCGRRKALDRQKLYMSSSLDLEDEPVAAGCANATTIAADDFPSGLPYAVSKKTLSSTGQRITGTRVIGGYPQKMGSVPLSR